MHVLLKEPPVVLQDLRSLLVQRVLGVGFLGEGQGAGFSETSRCSSRYRWNWEREAEQELTRNRYWRP